jgi:acetyl esterase/lipase
MRIFAQVPLLAIGLAVVGTVAAAEPRAFRDVEYARAGTAALALDLYVPPAEKPPPLVVWVHGGAWRSGSKSGVPILPLCDRGYAIASVDYRLSPVAKFPAQVHDLKASIRFLRASADKYGIDAARIAITGGSAGGHLAALVGVTNSSKEHEGDVGEHRGASSDVQAIVDFYGPTNLTTILAQSTPHGLSVREPALKLLFGGAPEEQPELAKLASPVLHVDASDPPLLIFHGDQDPQVPINQSHELVGAYKKRGVAATLEVVYGGVHGGKLFYTPEQLAQVAEFLDKHLKALKESRNK